jgi:ketosteroid isomerase-like protein
MSNSDLIRKVFLRLRKKDRKAVESLLSNDFAFTSSYDYRSFSRRLQLLFSSAAALVTQT